MRALTAVVCLSTAFNHALAAEPLRLERTIPLPGVSGRIDHLSLDATGKRLWVAALGNDTVEVIDLETGARARSIEGVKEPQGVALIADQNRVIVASGEDGMLRAFDPDFKVTASVSKLDDADNVRLNPIERRVYVGYGRGAIAVFDGQSLGKLGEFHLTAHPESFQLESQGSRIFVNVPHAGHVAVIDRNKDELVATWPVKEARGNYAMALDEPHHRLFVICRQPARMLVLDTDSGNTVASVDVCGDADDAYFDAAHQRIYVSGGEGCLSVISQPDADHYQLDAIIPTAQGARTSLFVPETNRIYLAVPSRKHQDAEIREYVVQY